MRDDFVALILTNRRPGNVVTYKTLRQCGYTGRIAIVVDNEDPTLAEYQTVFGEQVVVFDKQKVAAQTQVADNFPGLGAVIFARNASWEVAERLGCRYFVQLDDDYTMFSHRFDGLNRFRWCPIKDLDAVWEAMLRFYEDTPFLSVAMMQGGDYIGGAEAGHGQKIIMSRKAMNSFICSTDRPFKFLGRLNDDVNAYVVLGHQGGLFGSFNQVDLTQIATQAQAGGMGDLYRRQGTYTKSFYSVMLAPGCVSVSVMQTTNTRIHHHVHWNRTAPKIIRPEHRKLQGQAAA